MSNRQDPFDQLLDLFVYAPLGLALSAKDLVPSLAEKGRRHFAPQTTAARFVGKMAVRQGQREAEDLIRRARRQAEALLGDLLPPPRAPGGTAEPAPGEGANGSAGPGPAAETAAAAPRTGGTDAPAPPPPVPSGPDVSELAIPGYDTLSASQVVQRLEGLGPEELEAVRAYEQAGRGRKTVLTRIAQLKGSP